MNRKRRRIRDRYDALQTVTGIFIGTGLGLLVWIIVFIVYKAVT